MLVFRICLSQYAGDQSGTGAALYGGRWNPVGIPVMYTASSISLACLEYMAHNIHLMASARLSLTTIKVSDKAAIKELSYDELPTDWNNTSYLPQSTQQFGVSLVRDQEYYLMKVPSAVVPGEFNYLLNPSHPLHRYTKVIEEITPFQLDNRIFDSIK